MFIGLEELVGLEQKPKTLDEEGGCGEVRGLGLVDIVDPTDTVFDGSVSISISAVCRGTKEKGPALDEEPPVLEERLSGAVPELGNAPDEEVGLEEELENTLGEEDPEEREFEFDALNELNMLTGDRDGGNDKTVCERVKAGGGGIFHFFLSARASNLTISERPNCSATFNGVLPSWSFAERSAPCLSNSIIIPFNLPSKNGCRVFGSRSRSAARTAICKAVSCQLFCALTRAASCPRISSTILLFLPSIAVCKSAKLLVTVVTPGDAFSFSSD